MTKLAETYLRLDIRLAEPDILELRAYLQRRAATFAEGLFGQVSEFAVYVEDGSIRVWLAVAGVLYVGLVNMDRSGPGSTTRSKTPGRSLNECCRM